MKEIRHFIWDFDGTLFDTYPVIIRDLRLALGEFGRDCDPVEAMKLMLDSIGASLDHYAEEFGIPRDTLNDVYMRYHNSSGKSLVSQPIAGVREVLERIRSTGRHSYIFTHRNGETTARFLEKYGLEGYFRDIIGPDSPHFAVKPAPDAVLYLMKKYGMSSAETVMVGDRERDLGSGRNAGIKTAHLICPQVPETLSCDWRLESFAHMRALL